MKKRKLLAVLGLAVSTGCFAQDDITLKLNSGNKSYKIDDVKSITFDGTDLKVNKLNDEADTYAFADIVNISFDTATGIDNLKIAGGKLTVSVEPGSDIIRIGGYDARQKYSVSVFNLAGEKVIGIDSWTGDAVSVASLPKGVYVLKINNTTLKFRK